MKIKDLLSIIALIFLIGVWMFPVIISFVTWNFWYIFLYIIWWVPATMITGIAVSVSE
jgi:hypothetical protein